MKDLLNDSRHEILALRRENEILRAKVEVMDLFALVLNTTPNYRSQGMAIDVAWRLQKEIDALNAREASNAK
jgi:sulfate adenylyltransferase subunit 1 (EFTu-like GTPase family)